MRHRDDDPPSAGVADSASAAVTSEDEADGIMSFADTVRIDADRHQLWAALTDPETLAACVPGAESVERVSEREYACEITRSISRLTVSLQGEAELVEVHPPDYVVTRGSAFDSKTGSDLEVLAAMELQEADDGRVELSYSAAVELTGGAGSIGTRLLRPVVGRDVDAYFENVRAVVTDRDES